MIVKRYENIFRKEASAMSTEPTVSASDHASQQPSRHRLKRGDLVHVRPGARHPIYPDLPMGGWTGTIERVQRHREYKHRRYWVHFLPSTTERLHPIYLDREERDNDVGYQPWDNWVAEELLEPGEAPPETIEHPSLSAWAQQAGEEQVRTLFGLSREDEYPSCDDDTARVWKDFLSQHLPLPRRLRVSEPYNSDDEELLLRRILGPNEVPSEVDDRPHGLYAEVSVDGEIEVVRLEHVLLFDDDPYETLLCDYAHWYEVVHGHDDSWADDEGMSPAEFEQIFRLGLRAAWKAHFGRLPGASDMELAKSLADQIKNPDAGRIFDRADEPVIEQPEEVKIVEPIRAGPRVGRNDPCPCGSGKKYKKCCLRGQ